MTVTDAVTLRLASLVTTAECAAAENPNPPNSSGMIMPKKPWRFMRSHASGERSPLCTTSHSLIMAQSSSTGPSRNARSRSDSGWGVKRRSFSQSGLPEKRSPSHQTVPASSATRSVSPIRGSSGLTRRMTQEVTTRRRSGRTPNNRATMANPPATTSNRLGVAMPANPHQRTPSPPARTHDQYASPWYSRARKSTARRPGMRIVMRPPLTRAWTRTWGPRPSSRRSDSTALTVFEPLGKCSPMKTGAAPLGSPVLGRRPLRVHPSISHPRSTFPVFRS